LIKKEVPTAAHLPTKSKGSGKPQRQVGGLNEKKKVLNCTPASGKGPVPGRARVFLRKTKEKSSPTSQKADKKVRYRRGSKKLGENKERREKALPDDYSSPARQEDRRDHNHAGTRGGLKESPRRKGANQEEEGTVPDGGDQFSGEGGRRRLGEGPRVEIRGAYLGGLGI